jgi:hypothetical protein
VNDSPLEAQKSKPRPLQSKCFLISFITFITCWVALFSFVYIKAKNRSLDSFIRGPLHSRSLAYPGWLLREARKTNPKSSKILFFGDSVVYGFDLSNAKDSLGANFASHLKENQQLFVFALSGLTMKDIQNLIQENASPSDFIIISLNHDENQLSGKAIMSESDQKFTPTFLIPFLLIREEFSMILGQQPTWLIHQLEYKIQEHIFSRIKTEPKVLMKDLLANSQPPKETVPFSTRTLQAIESILPKNSLLQSQTLVYSTPENPEMIEYFRQHHDSVLLENAQKLTTLFRKTKATFIDYSNQKTDLKANHFQDNLHLTEDGCRIFGGILEKDWSELFSKEADKN